MRQMTKLTRWLAVAGVTFGFGVQSAGSAEYLAKEIPEPLKDAASVAIHPTTDHVPVGLKEMLPSVDYQLVQVLNDKKLTASRHESLYRPPSRGAPGGRVGGGTRGPDADLPLLWALVPDHLGFSTEAQPRLMWYLSKATAYPVEFTLIDETGVTPIIETRLASPFEPGMHIIRLADYDVKLEKGKSYQWFVSVISDPERRSTDILVGGMIQVGDAPVSVGETVQTIPPVEAAKLWAQNGFWYDAMSVISTGIQANPSDAEMHALRASLLEEVDLATPAQEDRQHGL